MKMNRLSETGLFDEKVTTNIYVIIKGISNKNLLRSFGLEIMPIMKSLPKF